VLLLHALRGLSDEIQCFPFTHVACTWVAFTNMQKHWTQYL